MEVWEGWCAPTYVSSPPLQYRTQYVYNFACKCGHAYVFVSAEWVKPMRRVCTQCLHHTPRLVNTMTYPNTPPQVLGPPANRGIVYMI
jgi:hypothetical protein